jgi:hypothetical protein
MDMGKEGGKDREALEGTPMTRRSLKVAPPNVEGGAGGVTWPAESGQVAT